MVSKRNVAQSRMANIAIHLLTALFSAIIVSALILSLFSVIMSKIDIPLYMTVPFATIGVSIAVFMASVLFAYLEGRKGLVCGISLGLAVFVLLWVANAINGDIGLTSLAVLKVIAFCCAGCIGGSLGISLKEHRLKRH